MEDPVQDIVSVIYSLTTSAPSVQRKTVETYFVPDASLTHPFCRTGSFSGSRWLVSCVYRWYRILSPKVEIGIDSIAFDSHNLLLYVTLHQLFHLWFIPFHLASVSSTTRLRLTTVNPSSSARVPEKDQTLYWIQSQTDLYQPSEFIKFPFSWPGALVIMALQFMVTIVCVVGSYVAWPISWLQEHAMRLGQ